MSPLPFVLVLALAQTAAAEVLTREVSVGVSTKDGGTVDDLTAADFEIEEDGKKRAVLGIARDQRPVDVALILDSSQAMGNEYATTLVPAAMEFWRALPEWTRLTVWTCGGRAFQAVEFGVDPEAGEGLLRKIATGGYPQTLETMIQASSDLQEEPLARRVVVAVTGDSIPHDQTVVEGTLRAIPEAQAMPVVVLITGGGGFRFSGRGISWEVAPFFNTVTKAYGGGHDVVVDPGSAAGLLKRTAAELTSQYLIRFESESEHPTRPDVKVDRKDVRARAGLAMLAAPEQ
jgi:hypothetical protein